MTDALRFDSAAESRILRARRRVRYWIALTTIGAFLVSSILLVRYAARPYEPIIHAMSAKDRFGVSALGVTGDFASRDGIAELSDRDVVRVWDACASVDRQYAVSLYVPEDVSSMNLVMARLVIPPSKYSTAQLSVAIDVVRKRCIRRLDEIGDRNAIEAIVVIVARQQFISWPCRSLMIDALRAHRELAKACISDFIPNSSGQGRAHLQELLRMLDG